MITPLHTVGLLLCLAGALALKSDPEICSPPPKLSFNGLNPLEEAKKAGNVTVVALLDANCGYCVLQALLLQRMKRKFDRKKLTNITYVIINKKSAKGKKHLFERDGFRVYESEKQDSWKKFKGLKDDFFIYNKCGRLVDHVKHPYSYLGWPYVRVAILRTYADACRKICPESAILRTYADACRRICPEKKVENKDTSKPK